MSDPRPRPRGGSGARYTPPAEPALPTRNRVTMVRVVAALVIAAMLLAPLAFLFTL